MSKLEEIKNGYLLGEMFGEQWYGLTKNEFDWLIEQAEKSEKVKVDKELFDTLNNLLEVDTKRAKEKLLTDYGSLLRDGEGWILGEISKLTMMNLAEILVKGYELE